MSSTISFRVADEIPEELERQGKNPHEVARQAFLQAVRRLEQRRAFARLTSAAKDPIEPVDDSIERGRA